MSNTNSVEPTERIRGQRVEPTEPTERIRGRILQRLRTRIMQDQPLCRMCDEKGFVTPGAELDHIVPLFMGGSNEDTNLQMLCVECHLAKTAKDLGIAYRPTIGVDGWPIADQTGRAGQNPRAKLPETGMAPSFFCNYGNPTL